MPIGSPGKLPPRGLATGLGHAREPEINAIGQNRSEESLPIFGRRLGAQMQESISQTRPRQPLAAHWGSGTTSSSDAQFFHAGARGEVGGLVNLHYGSGPGRQVLH